MNIIAANARFVPSKPKRPPLFSENLGFLNYPSRPSSIPNYPNPSVINNPSFMPKQPPYYSKNKNTTTVLKPVPIENDEVKNDITEKPKETTTVRPSTQKELDKSTEKSVENDVESTNELLTSDSPVRSVEELSGTIIPIVAVVGVFMTVGIIAFVFRKKIYNGKQKESKDDMVGNKFNFNLLLFYQFMTM